MQHYLLSLCISFFLLVPLFLTAQISAGGNLKYDVDLKRIGFTAKVKYVFAEETWAAAPSYSIYPTDGATVRIIDADAHYHFAELFANDIIVYGIGGIGFVNNIGVKKIALNGGIGTSVPTNTNWNIFAEVKFRVHKGTGTQIGVGALYEF